jgi:hypothetical protein
MDERYAGADCQGLVGGKDRGWLGVAVEGGSRFVWRIDLSELGFGVELADETLVHIVEELGLVKCKDHDEWLWGRGFGRCHCLAALCGYSVSFLQATKMAVCVGVQCDRAALQGTLRCGLRLVLARRMIGGGPYWRTLLEFFRWRKNSLRVMEWEV